LLLLLLQFKRPLQLLTMVRANGITVDSFTWANNDATTSTATGF
jgi:hypothetical protein